MSYTVENHKNLKFLEREGRKEATNGEGGSTLSTE